ncbi:hypothetical protein GGR56DRAFT_613990 [Xylariaceae sp. FL0804]|nr:hypothetical protein GGR56DRAFT_613990 [Xylariaceae sp. FL0804]
MDGFAKRRQQSFDAGRPKLMRSPTFAPPGSALVDAYQQDSLNGFENERPRYNPMNPERLQSSALVDLKDTVQVHLLTESALFESREYEILSQEEADDLKKQCQALQHQIDQTRSNLAMQSKYRDAAISMSRLYSPTRSGGDDDAAREAETEREATQQKCESLASELWMLEKQMMGAQRRLLEHTAGILQHAHKANQKASMPPSKVTLVDGVPASPESMYTTSIDNHMDFLDDGFVFDEASLYRSFDTTDPMGSRARADTIEIPLKSPGRGQKQLAEESERLRDENAQLRAQSEALLSEINELRSQESDQYHLISDTERKLEMFNSQLREVIVQADPAKGDTYEAVPSGQLEPRGMIESHLDYLGNGLTSLGDSQGNSSEVAGKIQALNLQIQDVLMNVNPSHPSPPTSSRDVDEQLGYFQDSLRTVEDELQRAADMTNMNSADKQKSEQAETVLTGLWDIIHSGFADIRRRRQEQRSARLEKGLELDEEDMSDGESFDLNEAYSLPAFSNKVQWLYSQTTRLQDQKGVLKRQIKQQRELNNKSDSEKDQQLEEKASELEEAKMSLSRAEEEADKARSQLSQAFEDLENLQNDRSEESAAIEEARGQLRDRNAKITSLEADTRDVQTRLAAAEANIETITAQLNEANDAKDAAEKAVEEKQSTIQDKDNELEQLTGMVAELKMEATLVKAELDGAYGSRKERAAEVAKLHNSSESAKMQIRLETLEKELRSATKDLTDVVKQSVASEKKIGELEVELDRAKSERARIAEEKDKMGDVGERLEADLSRLRKEKEQVQEELDSHRLRSTNGPASPGGGNKTSFLTDSYRVGLRAERKKFDEQLRAEQALRRKIEDELRMLKRAQGPGKSPLSPR